MKYSDGQEVRVGDQVKLGNIECGLVVASIDSNEYDELYPREQWAYLKKGVIIKFPKYGLIHYEEPEIDLQLVKRSSTSDAS